MSAPSIFIHALFRTGSTYIWNKFRQFPDFVCYYEPFHQLLRRITPKNVRDCLTRNFKAIGHPELERHYLYEYETLLREDEPGLPFFKKELSYDWFCLSAGETNPDQKRYIDFLMENAAGRIPLFQFNRTALRSGWFKFTYPRSLNIYLFRNPRDQWQSYAAIQARTGYDKFFIMDLIALSKNRDNAIIRPLGHAVPLLHWESSEYEQEELFYQTVSRAYTDQEKYFIFYYLWLVSLMENAISADSLWDIDALATDHTYREEVRGWLIERNLRAIDFGDCCITRYSEFPLPPDVMTDVEDQVQELISPAFANDRFKPISGRLPVELKDLLERSKKPGFSQVAKRRISAGLDDWLRQEREIRALRSSVQFLREVRSAERKKEEGKSLATQTKLLVRRYWRRFRKGLISILRWPKNLFLKWRMLFFSKRPPRGVKIALASLGPQERKISVAGQLLMDFGRHRSGLKYGLQYLLGLHHPNGTVLDAFVERTFCWRPRKNFVYDRPWVGFIHVPPRLPEWFYPDLSNCVMFGLETWQKSLPWCRSLFAFSKYHQRHLIKLLPIPVETLYLPSEMPRVRWSWGAFEANPRKKIVQVGWWLRKIHAIFQFPQTSFQKVFLHVGHPHLAGLMEREKEILSWEGAGQDIRYESVEIVPFLPNREYDFLLSQNIVFMFLYDSSACNAIVECMVRRTPLLINPLEAVVEYLGEDYPFYFQSLAEAAEKAMDRDLIYRTHEYLIRHPLQQELSGASFLRTFLQSGTYQSLSAPRSK